MNEAQYPIQLAAGLTGLSAHVIRIGEQRYRAVEPQRTPTKRRLYSPGQIERLKLLRYVTLAGSSIGQVAQLPTDKLGGLVAASVSLQTRPERSLTETPAAGLFLDDFLMAIKSLDAHALENALKRGAIALGALGMLQRVIAPLVQAIGDLWRDGTLTPAHEHFASAAIRVFLGNAAMPAYRDALEKVGALPIENLAQLGSTLDNLRKPQRKADR